MGFEPTTPGLKVRSSTAELQALGSMLAGSAALDNGCAQDAALGSLPPCWAHASSFLLTTGFLPAVHTR